MFESALGLDTTEWDAFLDRECGGNQELKHEVLSLLAALPAMLRAGARYGLTFLP